MAAALATSPVAENPSAELRPKKMMATPPSIRTAETTRARVAIGGARS